MSLYRSLGILTAQSRTKMRFACGISTAGGVDDVVTGLKSVVDCGAHLATDPVLLINYVTCDALTASKDWGQIRLRHGGYTATDDATPVQKAGAVTSYWWAIGT